MKILRCELDNFLSYDHEIFEVPESGLLLIQGENKDTPSASSNGSGKSALIDAILWCLFGKTARGVSGNDVVRRNTKGGCAVEVILIDDKDRWRVCRYQNHSQFKNQVHLFHGQERIELTTKTQTQDEIESILGLNFESATQTVLLSGKDIERFSLATDAEKKKFLEGMLDLDRFIKYQDISKTLVKNTSLTVTKMEGDINYLNSTLSDVHYDISSLQSREDEFQKTQKANIEAKQNEIETLEERANSPELTHPTSVMDLRRELANNILEEGEINLKIKEVTEELKGFDIHELRKSEIDTSYEATAARDLCFVYGKNIKWGAGDKCPVCSREFGQEDINTLLSDNIDNLTRAQQDRKRAEASLKGIREAIEEHDQRIKSLEQYHPRLSELYSTRNDIQNALNQLKLVEEKRNSILSIIEIRRGELSNIKQEKSPFPSLIEDKEKQLQKLNSSLNTMKADLTRSREDQLYYDFWVKGWGLKGIRAYILNKVTPYLTTRVNRYLGILMGGDIRVGFEVDEKAFKINVDNKFGSGTYKGNSSGEKQRIDLAVSLALRDLCISRTSRTLDLLVLDEVLINLDSIGIEMIIDLLNELESNSKSIILLTNNEEVAEHLPNRMLVQKENCVSSIVK